RIVDALKGGATLSSSDADFLRSFLPEPPKQKTLEEIIAHVHNAWTRTNYNEWTGNTYNPDILLEEWLVELHVQLQGLKDTPAVVPELPAGMRLAEHEELGRVVVSPSKDRDGDYAVFYLHSDHVWGAYLRYVNSSDLTFIDAEPAKPAHPEFLDSPEDYKLAPNGTIVVYEMSPPWVKRGGTWLSAIAGAENSSDEM